MKWCEEAAPSGWYSGGNMATRRWARWIGRAGLMIWELPQNALGVSRLGLAFARGRVEGVRFEDERVMVEMVEGAAISLGLFVLWTTTDNPYVPVGAENRAHEYGHSIQSRMLGPLYLPVIGVPSTMRVAYAVAYRAMHGRRWDGYYRGFPEKWADELGGVDPKLRPAP